MGLRENNQIPFLQLFIKPERAVVCQIAGAAELRAAQMRKFCLNHPGKGQVRHKDIEDTVELDNGIDCMQVTLARGIGGFDTVYDMNSTWS